LKTKNDADPILLIAAVVILLVTPQLISEMPTLLQKFLAAALGYGLVFLAASFAFYLARLDQSHVVFGKS